MIVLGMVHETLRRQIVKLRHEFFHVAGLGDFVTRRIAEGKGAETEIVLEIGPEFHFQRFGVLVDIGSAHRIGAFAYARLGGLYHEGKIGKPGPRHGQEFESRVFVAAVLVREFKIGDYRQDEGFVFFEKPRSLFVTRGKQDFRSGP